MTRPESTPECWQSAPARSRRDRRRGLPTSPHPGATPAARRVAASSLARSSASSGARGALQAATQKTSAASRSRVSMPDHPAGDRATGYAPPVHIRPRPHANSRTYVRLRASQPASVSTGSTNHSTSSTNHGTRTTHHRTRSVSLRGRGGGRRAPPAPMGSTAPPRQATPAGRRPARRGNRTGADRRGRRCRRSRRPR